jgi:hypothetical protein
LPGNSSHAFDPASFYTQLLGDLEEYRDAEDIRSDTYHPLPGAELGWREWLSEYVPWIASQPFAPRHISLWEWFERLEPGIIPKSRIEIWPRGGAKSSTGELACARLAFTLKRRFVLYISETQDQANMHVQAVSAILEQIGVERLLSKYGISKGWRTDLLRTANGFSVAAFGLDAAARGVRIENFRPDLEIFDDVDNCEDTAAAVAKKERHITLGLLGAGSPDLATLFLQNKIHKDSIAARLLDYRAEFLLNRDPPTVEPAVIGLQYERDVAEDGKPYYRITAGTPTWEGQDLKVCEAQMNLLTARGFLRESQHQVDEDEDGLWRSADHIDPFRVVSHPALNRVIVAIDPSATATGDPAGIVAVGVSHEWNGRIAAQPHAYVLRDASIQGSPGQWAKQAVAVYKQLHGTRMVAESNQGGEMVAITIKTIPDAPPVILIHASKGKLTRAEPVHKLYEDGRVHHVGEFPELEYEMCHWQPGMPSPNRMDALVWAITAAILGAQTDGGAAGGKRSIVTAPPGRLSQTWRMNQQKPAR